MRQNRNHKKSNIKSTIKTRMILAIVFIMTMAGTFAVVPEISGESGQAYAATAVTVNNATGYVNSSSGAYLRAGSTTTSRKVKLLKDNTKLTIYKEIFKSNTYISATKKWYYVKAGTSTGYIRSDLVDGVKYSAVNAKITAKCNYRVGPGTKMAVKGSFAKGKAIMVFLKAKPTSATQGSSATWYKIKYNSRYYYVCSSCVKLVGSIFVNNPDTSGSTDSGTKTNTGTSTTGTNFANMTDAQFTTYLTNQGFPASYRTKLLTLHKKHPNWVFKAKKTGINWSDAVTKENANGVSLIEGSQPVSYRATDSNSFRASSLSIYKNADSSSTKIGTIYSNTSFTLLDEVWKGTTQYLHIKTKSGTKGYVKRWLNTQSYTDVINGVTTDSVNMRKGAGTSNSVIKTLAKGVTLKIVLQTKDSNGNIWYKVKTSAAPGYGYVSGQYLKVNDYISKTTTTTTTTLSANYPIARTTALVYYRATPDTDYPIEGSWSKGTQVTVIASVSANNDKWYKVNKGNKIVYARAQYLKLISGPTNVSNPTDPTDPSVPTDSIDPVDPANPADPTEPTDPADTTEPSYPTEPTDPVDPSDPVDSTTEDKAGDSEDADSGDDASDTEDGESGDTVATPDTTVINVPVGKVPATLYGTTKDELNYRKGAGTGYAVAGTFNKGVKLTITGVKMNGDVRWYSIKKDGVTYYVCAEYVDLNLVAAPGDSKPTVKTTTATKKIAAKPSSLNGTGTIAYGTYIPKDGSNWFNAKRSVVAYYMDPRNFLNENRIYMFENLSYQKDYQTTAVVSKVITGTKLPTCGFTSKMFVNAGATYNINPVFLAARARQETGGGSVAINGTSYNGKVVYNPFNIGATSSANPVWNGMKYAYNHGWTTQTKAVNGGARFMADGYINAGQNSNYYQRFNVAKGISYVGTHQYMTNVQAPYHEAYSTAISYKSYGITNQPLTFIIPVFNNMPSETHLP